MPISFKTVIKRLSGIIFFSAILLMIPLSLNIAEKYAEKNQTHAQSAMAYPGQTHTDFNELSLKTPQISEYSFDSYESMQWHELSIDEESEADIQTQAQEADGTIRQITYGIQDGGCFVKLTSGAQVKNCTTETSQCLYAQSNLLPDYTIDLNGEPQVLIIHTHATESFEIEESNYYDSDFNARTTDTARNVIAVGEKIAQALNSSGIGVIHDTTLHDYPSYTGSYERSAETVKAMLAQYPSIKVVFDIHRDSITASDGTRIAPVTVIDDKKAAQIMIISGCDDGTMNMPNYMQNFRLACLIQNTAANSYEGLMRPILFDYRKYNQDLTTGSLLIEVGSAANSLDQALYSGELIGKAISDALVSIATPTQ